MKMKSLGILAVGAAVLVGLAYLTTSRKTSSIAVSPMVGRLLVPALEESDVLNGIEKIVFESTASTVTVVKIESGWSVPNKYGYPADFEKIQKFLLNVANMRIGQQLPGGRRQLEKLKLVPPSDKSVASSEAVGTLMTFFGKKGNAVASVVIGKEHMKVPSSVAGPSIDYGGYPDGRYVSVDGNVYVVADTFSDLPKTDKDWLEDDLANEPAADVVEVTITNAERERLVLHRKDGTGSLTLDDLASDEEMDTSKAGDLANVLSYLTLSDVADPATPDDVSGMDKPTVCVYRLKNGKVYTLKVGLRPKDTDERYVRLSAAFEPPPEPEAVKKADKEKQEDEAERKKAEEEARKRKEERENLSRTVRELNEKVGKWLYLVRAYKIDSVTALRQELVKKKAAEQKKEEQKEGENKGEKPAEGSAAPQADEGKKEAKSKDAQTPSQQQAEEDKESK